MDQLAKMGVKGVGRYIGWDSVPGFSSTGKNVTKAEAAGLIKAGMCVWLAFEYDPQAPAKGWKQGLADGALATRQLAELGAPPDMTAYFAADWDVPDYAPSSADPVKKLGPVADYFRAIRSLKPAYPVGIYGGYWPVSRLLTSGLADMAWQTVAWSGTNVDQRIAVFQHGFQVAGGNADLNEVKAADFGQWPRPAVKRPGPVKVVLSSRTTSAEPGTLSGLVQANPVNHVSTVLRLTAENSAGSVFPPGLAAYVDDGNWDARLPRDIEIWYYETVPA